MGGGSSLGSKGLQAPIQILSGTVVLCTEDKAWGRPTQRNRAVSMQVRWPPRRRECEREGAGGAGGHSWESCCVGRGGGQAN